MAGPDEASVGPAEHRLPDWEAFYRDYRKPGYVEGFEITTKLGGGMFGLVFRARRMSIGKDYAIKFLKVDDAEVRGAVLSELSQVNWFAQIDHPNLVAIEDRGEVDGIPYLVMAFAGSETLRDRMPVDQDGSGVAPNAEQKHELLSCFLQCCRGLQALHERGLVHFDLKPANVFLKGSVARLGDYGLSKLVTHSRGSLSMGRGTPYYMAPEMLQRRGDHRSDIYSLGIVLYELLCGCVPFRGDSEWAVLKQHETKVPDWPAQLTAIERAVLQRCLAKDPAARFQSVREVAVALGGQVASGGTVSAAADDPVLAANEPPPLPGCVLPTAPEVVRRRAAQVARPSRRRSWRLLAMLMVLLAVPIVLKNLLRSGAQRYSSHTIEVDIAPTANRRSGDVRGDVEYTVKRALAAGRRAAQQDRMPTLQPLRLEPLHIADVAAHRAMLLPLREAPVFVPALAKRFAQFDRAAAACSIAMLQELDYTDGADCHRAENLQRLLAHLTGVDALVIELAGREPAPNERCLFAAVAGAWRTLGERYAVDDPQWQRLLRGMGRVTDVAEEPASTNWR